jgi:prolyl oligopeptidase
MHMLSHTLSVVRACLALLACISFAASAQTAPLTIKKPVTDTYHGVSVTENYRWLEDSTSADVKAWIKTQNEYSSKVIGKLPMRNALLSEYKRLYGKGPVQRFSFVQRGAYVFALKEQPPQNQAVLVALSSLTDLKTERVIVNPNVMNKKGLLAIDWFVPSLDGKLVAVCLSEGGSEDGSVHVFDVATGKKLTDIVPRVQFPTGGGSVAWLADGSGFYFTRYPHKGERPDADKGFYQQVWLHKLGTPESADTYVIGKKFPRIAEIALSSSPDGKYVLADVSNGDGGEHGFWLRAQSGEWKAIAGFKDGVRSAAFGRDGKLYGLALKGSPRGRVVASPLENANLVKAPTLIAQGDAVIESFVPTQTRMYVNELIGGPSQIRVFDLQGKLLSTLPTEAIADVSVQTRLEGDDVLISSQSFVTPYANYVYRAASDKLEKTKLSDAPKVKFDDAVVLREMATSKDGTKVPVNIVMKKGMPTDGSHPLLLTAYGGYGVSLRPYFSQSRRVLLDHGVIFAMANIRGGGEFGEDWHLAGNLTKKQNVFDDFIASAEHLIKRGYTRSDKLAIQGGSNGGLLMGAVLTQRPELFRAVVSQVGIYDQLRVEQGPNGEFNVTEFGTVKDAAQFKASYAYSPYHNVKDGTRYPAVLFTTGENDGRVEPWHSRKFAARLHEALQTTKEARPVLLLTDPNAGHGIGSSLSAQIVESVNWTAFVFNELGVGAKRAH